jgi:hypothetical protein
MTSFKTIRQTAEAFSPKTHLVFHTMETKPVAPAWIQERLVQFQQPVGVRATNGSIYVWNTDGSVYIQSESGDGMYFEAVPDLAYALYNKNKGDFYQFHQDGTISCRIDGKTYWYSTPFEATPVETDLLLRKKWSAEKNTWLFEGVDLTTEELDADESPNYDSDDGGPRCCRGCWKNALTPEEREKMELRTSLEFYKLVIEKYKQPAAEGDEKAKYWFDWYTECQTKFQKRWQELEEKKLAAVSM